MTQIPDTYRMGVAAVIGGLFLVLFAISVLELWCELVNVESISYRIEKWAHGKPWFATTLILLWAVLLAHFFLNPLPAPPAAAG